VLEKVNLRIPAGKTVAIVGESGSGKSTLLKLLMGYYPPTDGHILIDGVDMQDYELATLRDRIGLVSQDAFVFNGTVRDNIALGRPEATLEEVFAAAQAAGLGEFIKGLPERYETVIGERGANLSGGQRQRLAIARALLRRPDVLIFDEATSHLDTATEQAIQGNLKTALAGKTVVLVAHRLSTIKDADLIYVLHQGRVAEQGTHRELLALGGHYAALCRAQTGGNELPSRPDVAVVADSQDHRILDLYMAGHDDREIADRLGTSERKVRRMLERMRGLVEHQGFAGLFRSLGRATTENKEPPAARLRGNQSIYDLVIENN
jgi:ATP-binding cassette subfamily B protein